MRIVAISGGEIGRLETLELDAEVVRLTGKRRPRMVFLPTATADDPGDEPCREHDGQRLGCQVTPLRPLSTTTERPLATPNVRFGQRHHLRGWREDAAMMKYWPRRADRNRRRGAPAEGTVLARSGQGRSAVARRVSAIAPVHHDRLSRVVGVHRRTRPRPCRLRGVSPSTPTPVVGLRRYLSLPATASRARAGRLHGAADPRRKLPRLSARTAITAPLDDLLGAVHERSPSICSHDRPAAVENASSPSRSPQRNRPSPPSPKRQTGQFDACIGVVIFTTGTFFTGDPSPCSVCLGGLPNPASTAWPGGITT